jgi:hypothetical protein
MNHHYEVGQKWDMRIEQSGCILYKYVEITAVLKDGMAVVSLPNPVTFRPDGWEAKPANPTLFRQLMRQV